MKIFHGKRGNIILFNPYLCRSLILHTRNMNRGMIPLGVGGLGIVMTGVKMIGLLIEIALDMGISIPKASNFICLYAFGVLVGAPTLVMLTAKMPPKKVLFYLMVLFFLFNGLFAMALN